MIKYLLPLILLLTMPSLAGARQEDVGIAAIVNEEIISSADLANRMRFIVATTGLSDTADVRDRLFPQVVRQLIDETLQLQEAARLGIIIAPKDLEQAIAALEKQRGEPPGGLFAKLERYGVPKDTFLAQLRAQLAWSKAVIRKVRPQIRVSDEEVERARRRYSSPSTRSEAEIAVITLPVDKPENEAGAGKLAEKLFAEIKGGASFEAVAGQFSGQKGGGKTSTFWVQPEQLEPAVANALSAVAAGGITPPIRSAEGFTLVKVYNRRAIAEAGQNDIEVVLKEIVLKVKSDASEKDVSVLLSIGESVAAHPGKCTDKGIADLSNVEDFDITVTFKREILRQMAPALRTIAETLEVGEISTPFASAEGIRLFMLCEKVEVPPILAEKEKVHSLLFQEKIELEAQKYLRNLRRDAFIDVRL